MCFNTTTNAIINTLIHINAIAPSDWRTRIQPRRAQHWCVNSQNVSAQVYNPHKLCVAVSCTVPLYGEICVFFFRYTIFYLKFIWIRLILFCFCWFFFFFFHQHDIISNTLFLISTFKINGIGERKKINLCNNRVQVSLFSSRNITVEKKFNILSNFLLLLALTPVFFFYFRCIRQCPYISGTHSFYTFCF